MRINTQKLMKQFKNQPVNSDLQPFIQTRTYFIFMKWSQPDDFCLLMCNMKRTAATRSFFECLTHNHDSIGNCPCFAFALLQYFFHYNSIR